MLTMRKETLGFHNFEFYAWFSSISRPISIGRGLFSRGPLGWRSLAIKTWQACCNQTGSPADERYDVAMATKSVPDLYYAGMIVLSLSIPKNCLLFKVEI